MIRSALDVFVSYKAEDRTRLKPLVDALEAEGFSVWWDVHIGGGTNWRRDIEEHLDAAKCVIVAWTRRSVGPQGEFVRDEAGQARRRGTYLPIRFDAVELPLGFREVQALSLKGWKGDRSDARFQELADTIRERLAGKRLKAQRFGEPVRQISRRALVAGGASVAAVAAAGGGWFGLRPKPAAASDRIAVLPFANLSGDPSQAYFSDGIAEELRSSLSRVGLEVIGRASCDAVRNLDIKAAASKLGVTNVLTGSVRRSPSTIRINAQLVSGSDGVERWAQTYDRQPGDAIKIQTDIAENVAQALRIALGQAGRAALTLGGTINPVAQDLVLQVIHDPSDNLTGIDRKLALLNAAISLDPNYAEAYARKAFWLRLQFGKAQTAKANIRGFDYMATVADRAIAIAPTMGLGYSVRAQIYAEKLQLGLALADVRRGIASPGQGAEALGGYAYLLCLAGLFPEALRVSAKALSLDPLSTLPYANRAEILLYARRYTAAVETARRLLEQTPEQQSVRGTLGWALLQEGKIGEAEAEFRKLDPNNISRLPGEIAVALASGQRAVALDKFRELQSLRGNSDHYQYATIYAGLGQTEQAFRELDLAWDARDPGLSYLRVDMYLDPLRSDPRYMALLRRLGFP